MSFALQGGAAGSAMDEGPYRSEAGRIAAGKGCSIHGIVGLLD